MALVVHNEFAIETRRAVDDKFTSAMEDLSLVAHVGDVRYGEEPSKAVRNLRKIDDDFHTDIQSELRAIEDMLKRQQLAGTWYKEHDEGMADATPEEREAAMHEWVEQQIVAGDGSVSCALPASPSQHLRRGTSKVDQANPSYSYQQRRSQKPQTHDKVAVPGGQTGTVKRVRADREDAIVELDDGAEGVFRLEECELLEKAHPARTIVAGRSAAPRRPYSGPTRASQHTESELSGLFSRREDDGASRPGFLESSRDSRRRQIEERKHAHLSKMPPKSKSQVDYQSPPRKQSGVRPKFMDVHSKPVSAEEYVAEKQSGQPVGLAFNPETLCVLDSSGCAVAAEFVHLRGMRITHVAPHQPPFTEQDAVHNAAAIRAQLAKAQGTTVVALRAEPWSQRRAVEKKRREFQEKLPPKGAAKQG